jgi:hypothetical protein
MAIDDQPDPWPVPHWHVHRDHWPTHGRGRIVRTFKDEDQAREYLARWPMRMEEITKNQKVRVCFDRSNEGFEEVSYDGKTARMKRCMYPLCFEGYGNERFD